MSFNYLKMLFIMLLMFIILFLVGLYTPKAYAGEVSLKPYNTIPISNSRDLKITHGIGIECDYIFNNGILLYGSGDFNPIVDWGNLNIASVGIGYKYQGKYFHGIIKGGYANAHDSDMIRFRNNTIEKLDFGKGGLVEAGVGFSYTITEEWRLGVELTGRDVLLNDFNMTDAKFSLTATFKF